MFIDTHLHLNSKKYENYLEVIQRAKLLGVNKLITIGTSVEEIPEIKKIIQNEDLLSSSSDEEEIIVKKKHPKKKIIYIESESEEEEKPNKYNDVRTPTFKKPEPPRRIIQYL